MACIYLLRTAFTPQLIINHDLVQPDLYGLFPLLGLVSRLALLVPLMRSRETMSSDHQADDRKNR